MAEAYTAITRILNDGTIHVLQWNISEDQAKCAELRLGRPADIENLYTKEGFVTLNRSR